MSSPVDETRDRDAQPIGDEQPAHDERADEANAREGESAEATALEAADDEYEMVDRSELVDVRREEEALEADDAVTTRPADVARIEVSIPPPPRVYSRTMPPPPPPRSQAFEKGRVPPPPPLRRTRTSLPPPPRAMIPSAPPLAMSETVPPIPTPSEDRSGGRKRAGATKRAAAAAAIAAAVGGSLLRSPARQRSDLGTVEGGRRSNPRRRTSSAARGRHLRSHRHRGCRPGAGNSRADTFAFPGRDRTRVQSGERVAPRGEPQERPAVGIRESRARGDRAPGRRAESGGVHDELQHDSPVTHRARRARSRHDAEARRLRPTRHARRHVRERGRQEGDVGAMQAGRTENDLDAPADLIDKQWGV